MEETLQFPERCGNADRTLELFRLYSETHDEKIRERIILENMGLVFYVIRKLNLHLPESMEDADAVEYGLEALLESVDRFQVNRGLSFSTFAIPRIQGGIIDGAIKFGCIKKRDIAMFRLLSRYEDGCVEEKDLKETNRLLEDPKNYEVFLNIRARTNSVSVEENSELISECLEDEGYYGKNPEGILMENEDSHLLEKSLEVLDVRESEIIRRKYYGNETLRQIASEMKLSTSRASEIHIRAIRKMKNWLQNNEIY